MPIVAYLVIAVVLAAVGALDLGVGRPSLAPAYGLISMLAGWFGGLGAAVITVALSTGMHFVVDFHDQRILTYLDFVNQVLRTLLWMATGLLAVYGRRLLERSREQRGEILKAQEIITADLALARRVQSALMNRSLPPDERIEVWVYSEMARVLGGDFHELSLEDGHLKICVADVSGKGTAASLVTAMLRAILGEVRDREGSVADQMLLLNSKLCPLVTSTMFVTCFYADWDISAGSLSYVNAGHDPAILRRSDGRIEELGPTGSVLGVFPEDQFPLTVVPFASNDLLVVFTDGLTTRRTGPQERLGDERVREEIAGHGDDPCEQIGNCLLSLAPTPPGGNSEDDIVLVVLRAHAPSPEK